ncbi:MAG: zinc-ribbon domain-containing protein [Candidatus Bathyarchaeota archaeon]|nr:zinc-ribbon domain-containing protein [Candidatus Bathyarchaeota archaeon]
MSYCPKCGNPVEDTMTFCPRCGAPLKGTSPAQAEPVPPYQKRNEKAEKNENREKQEKGERGFIGYLIGGLILITLGLFSVIQISNPNIVNAGQTWALMLLIIGVIIIAGAIYVAVIARRHSPVPH